MLTVLQLPMPKETFAKMTPEDRSLFLLLGYALLWKLVIIATTQTPENHIEQRVSGAQTQILVRLTMVHPCVLRGSGRQELSGGHDASSYGASDLVCG